jgi:hypothetical protein
MQAIFLHSVDETFEPTGRKSFIQYSKLFSTYKQIILTKLKAQEDSEDREFKDMMAWYNAQVFKWFDQDDEGGNGSGSSGIDEVMNQIQDLDIGAQGNDEDRSAELDIYGDSDTHVCYHFFYLLHEPEALIFWHFGGNQVIPRPSISDTLSLVQPIAGPSNSQSESQTLDHPAARANTGDLDAEPAPSQPHPTRGRGPSKTAKEPQTGTRRSGRKK